MLKTIVLVCAAGIAALLAYAATRPDVFSVQRSTVVNASPEKVHALINDLRQFNTWNPFNRKDPNIQGSYRGPAAGPGAAYDFRGNREVGSGTVEIVETAPQKVTMRLVMVEPFPADNKVEFLLQPQGGATQVTWAMNGPSPYIAKLLGIFISMDRMVGGEFEAGLSQLKARAERG
jgi:hypothetical protein